MVAANSDSVPYYDSQRGNSMMGQLNRNQGQLFYSFCLEEVVPADHLVRDIAAVLDLDWVRTELAPYYSPLGRPSIDPVLMIRMLIVGYVFAIRSERMLCREVNVNLAYRWFCGLSIEDKIPDHSAFSRARHERFRDSDMFRRVFERVVEACIAAGLVGGEGFAVDASLIVADANKQRSIPGSEWNKARDPHGASRSLLSHTSRSVIAGTSRQSIARSSWTPRRSNWAYRYQQRGPGRRCRSSSYWHRAGCRGNPRHSG
jgi:transposase